MTNIFIALTLLLFELSVSLTYSIPKHEIHQQNVYEVQEKGGSLKFMQPKPEKPTLREIVFYHVVESAYGDDKSQTERSFTNAHGLPFIQDISRNSEGVRRKRETDAQNIPEAPQIPEIKYDLFPAYLRRLISTEKPEAADIEQESRSSSLTPNREEANMNQKDKQQKIQYRSGDIFPRRPIEKDGPRQPRTYGMILNSDGAYVWNDLFGQRELADPEDVHEDLGSKFRRPAIDVRYIIPEEKVHPNDGTRNTLRTQKDTAYKRAEIGPKIKRIMEERMKEIMANIKAFEDTELNEEHEAEEEPRTYGMNLVNGHGHVWNDIFTDPGISYDVGPTERPNEVDITREPAENPEDQDLEKESLSNAEVIPEADKENTEDTIDDLEDIFVNIAKFKQTTPSPVDKGDNKHRPAIHKDVERASEEVKSLSFEELMESEEFWLWVTEWTKMLTEIMRKYIKKTVETQVETQQASGDDEDKEDTPLGPYKDAEESTSNTEDTDTAKKEADSNRAPEIIIKKDKLIVNGIEIPFTHTTNFKTGKPTKETDKPAKDLKKRKHKGKIPEKDKLKPSSIGTDNKTDPTLDVGKNHSEHRIEIQNVYGSAVSSEKVTNIFVFYPNKEMDKVVHELKPLAGENGVFLIKPDKDKETDNSKEDISIEKEKEDSNKEDTDSKIEETGSKDESREPEKQVNGKPETEEEKREDEKKPEDGDKEIESENPESTDNTENNKKEEEIELGKASE